MAPQINETPSINSTLVPSLPAASFAELHHLATVLADVSPGFQIDVVDGKFVPHRSWPFTTPDASVEWVRLNELPATLTYELDCMLDKPEQYMEVFLSLPVQKIIIHAGSTDQYGQLFKTIRASGRAAVLAFTNDVPLSFVTPFIDAIDGVQIMGIAKVGRQGQPFDERTLTTARKLRDLYPALSIAVDGSVNAETIPRLQAAGVNHFAPGSAISRAPDPVVAYKHLSALLGA